MAWSYKALWKLLIDKDMKRIDLISQAGLNSKTVARMGKGESVSMEALAKICQTLNCRLCDVVEYIPDQDG